MSGQNETNQGSRIHILGLGSFMTDKLSMVLYQAHDHQLCSVLQHQASLFRIFMANIMRFVDHIFEHVIHLGR
jgi:hypothetical protein